MIIDSKRPATREVETIRPDYQPSRAELEADPRIDATFEEAAQAPVSPVRINYIPHPKRRETS